MNNSKLFSDEAANIYERAIGTLLKKNMLLYFAFADYEEVRVHYEHSVTQTERGTLAYRHISFSAVLESHEVRKGPQHL